MRSRTHAFRLIPVLILIFGALLSPFGAFPLAADVICEDVTAPVNGEATPTAPPQVLDATFPDEGGSLTIYAAASLTDAFAAMESNLEEANPNLDIVVETAGSQTLVTQLDQGAPADVLATANTSSMDNAVELDLIEDDPVPFTGNRLVIVAPAGNPAGIESIDDLGGDITLILAAPDVPAGNYTHLAICDYVESGAAPDGFVDAVNANLVSEEQDVRSVLAKIQLGEADAGTVYASDVAAAALAGEELVVIEFPEDIPTSALYPIAPVAGGDTELANAFIAYVLSDEGQTVLAEYGFTAP